MTERRIFDTDLPDDAPVPSDAEGAAARPDTMGAENAEPSLTARLTRSSVEADAIASHAAPELSTGADDAVGAATTAGTSEQGAGAGRLGEGAALGGVDRTGRLDDVAAAYGDRGARGADAAGTVTGVGEAQGADAGSGLAEDPAGYGDVPDRGR
jgi:hypothetical protein